MKKNKATGFEGIPARSEDVDEECGGRGSGRK
jgi:hypothetical protein